MAVLCLPVQSPCPGKFWFTICGPKCSHPIRLQKSLIINITGSGASVSLIFLHEDIYQGEVAFQITAFDWVCPVMPGYAQTSIDLLWWGLVISLGGISIAKNNSEKY